MSFSQLIFNHLTVSRLQSALEKNDVNALTKLLSAAKNKGWDMKKLIATPTFNGIPLLHWARSASTARILLELGADPLQEYQWALGTTSWYQKNNKDADMICVAIEYGVPFSLKNLSLYELQYYAQDKYLPIFKNLHELKKLDVNETYTGNNKSSTLLMLCAASNAHELGAWLIDQGARLKALELESEDSISAARQRLQLSLFFLKENELGIAVNEESVEFLDMLYRKFSSPEDLEKFENLITHGLLEENKKRKALEHLRPLAEKERFEKEIKFNILSTEDNTNSNSSRTQSNRRLHKI